VCGECGRGRNQSRRQQRQEHSSRVRHFQHGRNISFPAGV
jgi:hypothetical protein